MKPSKHDSEQAIDKTSMIGFFVLLIACFMIATDLRQKELEPAVAVQAVKDEPDPDVVRPILNISHDGEIIVRAEPIYDLHPNDYRKLEGYLADQARLLSTSLILDSAIR